MSLHICILAAGQSTRMKSRLSKMVHPLCGKPLIWHVHATAAELQPKTLGIVVGFQRDQIMEVFNGKEVEFVVQEQQLGTAHAVQEFLKQFPSATGTLLVLSGDTPLLRVDTLRELIDLHTREKVSVSLLTTELSNPKGYGRIVRNKASFIEKIVEEADASPEKKLIQEVNAAIYAFNIQKLREILPLVHTNNKQKEYYLPDVIELTLKKKGTVLPRLAPAEEVIGINNRLELADAARILRKRINERWMLNGVTMIDPERTYIDTEVRIGSDVVIYPNVCLEGSTMIGSDCTIYSNCRITDSYIDSQCVIYESCSVEAAHLGSGVKIGPFARLRPETVLGKGVRIGNFVELKKTSVGEGTKANHLAYLGDATIG